MVIGPAQSASRNRLPVENRPSAVPPSSDKRCFDCRLRHPPTSPSKYCLKICPHKTEFAPTRKWHLFVGIMHSRKLIRLQPILLVLLQASRHRQPSRNSPSTLLRPRAGLQSDAESAVAIVTERSVHYRRCRPRMVRAPQNCASDCSP